MKKLDKESEIVATVVSRSFAMSGNPGRYMSIENGPIAESNPKIKTSKNLLVGFMFRVTNLMQRVDIKRREVLVTSFGSSWHRLLCHSLVRSE